MTETLTCPSGLVLEVEYPKVRRLLAAGCGGEAGAYELADACMDRAFCSADVLQEEDAYFVACWAIEHLGEDADSEALTVLCELYGETPSIRLQIADPVLAFEVDCQLTADAQAKRESEQHGSGIAPDDPLYGFPKEDA